MRYYLSLQVTRIGLCIRLFRLGQSSSFSLTKIPFFCSLCSFSPLLLARTAGLEIYYFPFLVLEIVKLSTLDDAPLYYTFDVSHCTNCRQTEDEALARLKPLMEEGGFSTAWDDACRKWEKRWRSAFSLPSRSDEDLASPRMSGHSSSGVRSEPEQHFSGSLPVFTSKTHPEIEKLYYWAAMALVGLERTNFPNPRTFVISEGASNSLDGKEGIQFRMALKPFFRFYMRGEDPFSLSFLAALFLLPRLTAHTIPCLCLPSFYN